MITCNERLIFEFKKSIWSNWAYSFIFLLGSIIVSANMLIKNSDNIKMVDNEAWNKTHNAKEIAE